MKGIVFNLDSLQILYLYMFESLVTAVYSNETFRRNIWELLSFYFSVHYKILITPLSKQNI